MDFNAKIYIAGHRGLVGSALLRNLQSKGYTNIVLKTHAELDLTDQHATEKFFSDEKPDYVFLAAAKVGGIHANNTYPAQFIRENIAIQTNVIHSSYQNKVKRLLFLGSSCIYPKLAPQPMREEHLLTGPLEETNRPYALAKIAGIEMCWSYNREYGTQYLAVMPTNLYGEGDNYHPENSHVIPGLIRKLHEAKKLGLDNVEVWGTGLPRREFLFSNDMADACIFLINLPDHQYLPLLASERNSGLPPLINIGMGEDVTIKELAEMVKQVVGYSGQVIFDRNKPDGPFRKLMDVSYMQTLGWSAKTPLKQGLFETYEFFLNLEHSYKHD